MTTSRSRPSRQSVGHWGESIAADYLTQRGYKILAQNLRTPYGEIDLIASQGFTIVFIEVKTRTDYSYGYPEEAVNQEKREHLLQSAQAYLNEQPDHKGDWRIDIIAIKGNPAQGKPEVYHFENILSE